MCVCVQTVIVQCLFSEHISPAHVRRAASGSRCSVVYSKLFIVNVSVSPHCTKMQHRTPFGPQHTPTTREVDWMNGSQYNTNAYRQTDAQRFLPLLERRICPAPPFEASNILCSLLPKLRSSKNGIRTSPTALTGDFRKHSGPTPADDMAAQTITDCGNFTLDFKKHGFCASPLFLQTQCKMYFHLKRELRTTDQQSSFFSL